MRESMRLYATLIVWTGFSAITIVLFTSATSVLAGTSATVTLIALIVLAMAAIISTIAIWGGFEDASSAPQRGEITRAKAKRDQRARMERLIESLDDDAIDDLETILLERDHSTSHRQSNR